MAEFDLSKLKSKEESTPKIFFQIYFSHVDVASLSAQAMNPSKWNDIFDVLQSSEPSYRALALNSVLKFLDMIDLSISESYQRLKLLDILKQISVGDEIDINKFKAVQILGRLSKVFSIPLSDPFYKPIQQSTFTLFKDAFCEEVQDSGKINGKENDALDASDVSLKITSSLEEEEKGALNYHAILKDLKFSNNFDSYSNSLKIWSTFAIGVFMKLNNQLSEEKRTIIESIFLKVLSFKFDIDDSQELLQSGIQVSTLQDKDSLQKEDRETRLYHVQAAVINVLRSNIENTYYGRKNIYPYYYYIFQLSFPYKFGFETVVILKNVMRWTETNSEGLSDIDNTGRGHIKEIAPHPILVKIISTFLSFFYPLFPDPYIQAVPLDIIETLRCPGFIKRRWIEIKESIGTSKKYVDASKVGAHKFKKWVNSSKAIVKNRFVHADFDGHFDEYALVDNNILSKAQNGNFGLIIPNNDDVSFHLGEDGIVFDGLSYTKRIHLSNKSSQITYKVCIQFSESFSVFPSFCVLPPECTHLINVTFLPNLRSSEPFKVSGFLRIRTITGFPLERVSIVAYNGPLLKIYDSVIDYGFCSIGSLRKHFIHVKNISEIPSRCIVQQHELGIEKVFDVSPSFSIIQPGEVHVIEAAFIPTSLSKFSNFISIVGMGNESYDIELKGSGQDPLTLMERVLYFGPLFNENSYQKTITIRNDDPCFAIPLKIECSTPDEVIFIPNEVIIESLAEKQIKVKISPKLTGKFESLIQIQAPNCSDIQLPVHAFHGPFISIPISREIFLTPCILGKKSILSLPLVNHSDMAFKCYISGLNGPFFNLQVQNKTKNNVNLPVTLDALTGDTSQFNIRANEIFTIIITWTPTYVGLLHRSLILHVVTPFSLTYGPWNILSASLSLSSLQSISDKDALASILEAKKYEIINSGISARLESFEMHNDDLTESAEIVPSTPDDLRDLLRAESLLQLFGLGMTGENIFMESNENMNSSSTPSSPKNTKALEPIDPATVFLIDKDKIFFCFDSTYSKPVCLVNLKNISKVAQVYHVVPSRPIVCNSERSGLLNPNQSVNIELGLHRKTENVMHESFVFIMTGSMRVSKMLPAQAINGLLLDFGLKSGDSIQFYEVNVDVKTNRKLKFLNKCKETVCWEAMIDDGITKKNNFLFENDSLTTMGYCEPWKNNHIILTFKSSKPGNFVAKLIVSITDPNNKESKYVVFHGDLKITALPKESSFSVEEKLLDFGSIVVGSKVSKVLNMNYSSNIKKELLLSAVINKPFLIDDSIFKVSSSTYVLSNKSSVRTIVGSAMSKTSSKAKVGRISFNNFDVEVEEEEELSPKSKDMKKGSFMNRSKSKNSIIRSDSTLSSMTRRISSRKNTSNFRKKSSINNLSGRDKKASMKPGTYETIIPTKNSSYIAFEPHFDGLISGNLYIFGESAFTQVKCVGYAGIPLLSSNLGSPYLPNSPVVIDLGVIDTDYEASFFFELRNIGNMDFTVNKITFDDSPNYKAFVKMDKKRELHNHLNGNDAPRGLYSWDYYEDNNDLMLPDWDEIDFMGASEMEEDEFSLRKDSNEDFEELHIPLTIKKFQKAPLKLIFVSQKTGISSMRLNIWSPNDAANPSFTFCFQCTFQPALQFQNESLEFGVVTMNKSKTMQACIVNNGVKEALWSIYVVKQTVEHLKSALLSSNSTNIRDQDHLNFYPKQGQLLPGAVQEILFTFSPTMPHFSTQLVVAIRSSNYASSSHRAELPISATCGAALLALKIPLSKNTESATYYETSLEKVEEVINQWQSNKKNPKKRRLSTIDMNNYSEYTYSAGARIQLLNFGSIHIGSKKVLSFIINNTGQLGTKFSIPPSKHIFTFHVTEGFIEGQSNFIIQVSFVPDSDRRYYLEFEISWGDEGTLPLILKLEGNGGITKLKIQTESLNYGSALLDFDNVLPLKIDNEGTTETILLMSSNSSFIKTRPSNNIYIPPKSQLIIDVVFHPQDAKPLEHELIIKQKEVHNVNFRIPLLGVVCQPKFNFSPENILKDGCKFGISVVNQNHSRTFSIMNTGNLSVDFECLWLTLKPQYIKHNNLEKRMNPFVPVALAIDPNYKPLLLKDYSLDDMESFYPESIKIEPRKGSFHIGRMIQFTIYYSPQKEIRAFGLLLIKNRYQNVYIDVHGIGGDLIMEMDTPLSCIDFGLCRMDGEYKRTFNIINPSNLSYSYDILPHINDPFLDPEVKPLKFDWINALALKGFKIEYNPYCEAMKSSPVTIIYNPTSYKEVSNVSLQIRHPSGSKSFSLRGCGGASILRLYDENKKRLQNDKIDFDICPLLKNTNIVLTLVNEGNLLARYVVKRKFPTEFLISPMDAEILPGGSQLLVISFRPVHHQVSSFVLTFMYNSDKPLNLNVSGQGGAGLIEPEYITRKDLAMRGIDFELVTANGEFEKVFFIHNRGEVSTMVRVNSNRKYFKIGQRGSPGYAKTLGYATLLSKQALLGDMSDIIYFELGPGRVQCIEVKLNTGKEASFTGVLKCTSDYSQFSVPIRARGGTIDLHHQDDLKFGNIACNYIYKRTIVMFNVGTIPTNLTLFWKLTDADSKNNSKRLSVAKLATPIVVSINEVPEIWKKKFLSVGKNIVDLQTLRKKKLANVVDDLVSKQKAEQDKHSLIISTRNPMYQATLKLLEIGKTKEIEMGSILQDFKLQSFSKNKTPVLIKEHGDDISEDSPHIRVSPAEGLLSNRNKIAYQVTLNIPRPGLFNATLIIESSMKGVPLYEIPLSANVNDVKITVDNTGTLNFGKQPIGSHKVIKRVFTNHGDIDVKFNIINDNIGLNVTPSSGVIQPRKSIDVDFSWRPTEDNITTRSLRFETNVDKPLVLKIYAGGGTPILDMDNLDLFSFNRCMIRKTVTQYLTIRNIGTAVLNIYKFRLHEEIFTMGKGWPKEIVEIQPNSSFQLPIQFHPPADQHYTSVLSMVLQHGTHTLQLSGYGREAVLTVSVQQLEFRGCIVGNTYLRYFDIINAGDLKYPITLVISKTPELSDLNDFCIDPQDITIEAFGKTTISVSFKPTTRVTGTFILQLISVYSYNEFPIKFESGEAILHLSTDLVNFEEFECGRAPVKTLVLQNVGSISFSFRISTALANQNYFNLSRWNGLLNPNSKVEIAITFKLFEIGEYFEDFFIETEKTGYVVPFSVKGKCSKSEVKPSQWDSVDLGHVLVGDWHNSTLTMTNYGGYPLKVELLPTFPLKVSKRAFSVLGNKSESFIVSWQPRGAYQMRSKVSVTTNIGTYEIHIKGNGTYPQFLLRNSYLDFGICSIERYYTQEFTIVNSGLSMLSWSVPNLPDCYKVEPTSGIVKSMDKCLVKVSFKPNQYIRFKGNFIVESKGRYRIVSVTGVGGRVQLNIGTPVLNLVSCACDNKVVKNIELENHGSVNLTLTATVKTSNSLLKSITVAPSSFVLLSSDKTTLKVVTRVGSSPGLFEAQIFLQSFESLWVIKVSGEAVVIQMSKLANALINNSTTLSLLPYDIEMLKNSKKVEILPQTLPSILLHSREPRNVNFFQDRNEEGEKIKKRLLYTSEDERECFSILNSIISALEVGDYIFSYTFIQNTKNISQIAYKHNTTSYEAMDTSYFTGVPVNLSCYNEREKNIYKDHDDYIEKILHWQPVILVKDVGAVLKYVEPSLEMFSIDHLLTRPTPFLTKEWEETEHIEM